MAGSHYPHGFTNGVTIRGVPIQQVHPGKVFWVNGGDTAAASVVLPDDGIGPSDGNDGSYLKPFKTLDYAIGKCKANRGDIIMLMPGYTDTVGSAADITFDVAGVCVLGLGSGAKRPTFNFTATASTISLAAANVSIANCVFTAGVAEVVTMLSATGAADGLSMENCLFNEGTGFNWVDAITLATGADDLSWKNCHWIGGDTNNDACITGVAHDGFYIDNCYFASNVAQAAAHGLVVTSGNCTNVWIKDSVFRSNVDGALWVDFNGAANGGFVTNCFVSSIDTAGATSTGDFTGGHFFECYVSGEADKFGLVGGGGAVYNDA